MFGSLGEFVVRRAWWVIGGWLAVAIAIIATAPSLADITSSDQGSFLPPEYESVQAIDADVGSLLALSSRETLRMILRVGRPTRDAIRSSRLPLERVMTAG